MPEVRWEPVEGDELDAVQGDISEPEGPDDRVPLRDLVAPGTSIGALVLTTGSLLSAPGGLIGESLALSSGDFFSDATAVAAIGAGIAFLGLLLGAGVLRYRTAATPRWALGVALGAVVVGTVSLALALAGVGFALTSSQPDASQFSTG